MSSKMPEIEITGRLTKKSRNNIIEAAEALNSVCDGAHELDGQGFNGFNSPFFKYWLSVEANEGIKKDMIVIEMYQKLLKYKKQLEGFEIDYNDLKPEFEEKVVDPTWKVKLGFGKNGDKTFEEMANTDIGYLNWMATSPTFFSKQLQWAAQCVLANKPITKLEVKNNNGNSNVNSNDNKKENGNVNTQVKNDCTVNISLVNDELIIRFKYDEKLINLIKANINWQDREFDREQKVWKVKLYRLDQVMKLFPEAVLSNEIQTIVKNGRELSKRSNAMTSTKNFDLGEFGHGKTLLPYQAAGVEFIELAGGRAVLADEMGVGKTIQALAFLQLVKNARPAIIVCPASLKFNWKYEAITWLDTKDEIQVIRDGKKVQITGNIIIINYDVLGKHEEEIMKVNPKIMMCDEAHVLKTYKVRKVKRQVTDESTGRIMDAWEDKETGSNRAKTVMRMAKQIEMFIPITGTPVLNRPEELYPLLHMVDPVMYPMTWEAFKDFGIRYCNGQKKYIGHNKPDAWDFSGSSNLDELRDRIRKVMIRRTKEQVLPELPPKRRSSLVLELDNMKEYQEQIEAFRGWLLENKDMDAEDLDILPKIEYLKQMTVEGKIESAIDWLDNSFIQNGQKVVVFCTHKNAVKRLMEAFGKVAVKIDGDTSDIARQAAKDKFQTDKNILMFIGNIKAAGVGLTLTAASDVVFLEFDWTPAIHDQAEDRCHRIGQKDSVNAYYLISENTIDGMIVGMLERKRQVTQNIVGDKKDLHFELYDEKKLKKEIYAEVRKYFGIDASRAEQASAA